MLKNFNYRILIGIFLTTISLIFYFLLTIPAFIKHQDDLKAISLGSPIPFVIQESSYDYSVPLLYYFGSPKQHSTEFLFVNFLVSFFAIYIFILVIFGITNYFLKKDKKNLIKRTQRMRIKSIITDMRLHSAVLFINLIFFFVPEFIKIKVPFIMERQASYRFYKASYAVVSGKSFVYFIFEYFLLWLLIIGVFYIVSSIKKSCKNYSSE